MAAVSFEDAVDVRDLVSDSDSIFHDLLDGMVSEVMLAGVEHSDPIGGCGAVAVEVADPDAAANPVVHFEKS